MSQTRHALHPFVYHLVVASLTALGFVGPGAVILAFTNWIRQPGLLIFFLVFVVTKLILLSGMAWLMSRVYGRRVVQVVGAIVGGVITFLVAGLAGSGRISNTVLGILYLGVLFALGQYFGARLSGFVGQQMQAFAPAEVYTSHPM